MNYTKNYQLNQWEPADRVLRTDFNEDNRKIEEALASIQSTAEKGNCRIFTGSYQGTGVYGPNNPNTLTFEFEPLMLLMHVRNPFLEGSQLIWFRDGTNYQYPGNSNVYYKITWQGKTVSWYQDSYSNDNSGPTYQLNKKDVTYHYIAIGM